MGTLSLPLRSAPIMTLNLRGYVFVRYAVCILNTKLNNFICLIKSEVTVERILVCNVIKN